MPKMSTTKLSVMDKNPSHESRYRNLAFLATAALAVHVLARYNSHSDTFAGWLGWAMPTILTGFLLLGLVFYAAYGTQFFTLTTTHDERGREVKKVRSSSDPAREMRHFFYVQVVALTFSLGGSIDLLCVWYSICHGLWDQLEKDEPGLFLLTVTFCTAILGLSLWLACVPIFLFSDDGRSGKGSENGDAGSRAKLRTLVAAAEAYEKDLLSERERPQSKVEVTGKFLDVLREWQASDQ